MRAVVNLTRCLERVARIVRVDVKRVKEELFCIAVYLALLVVSLRALCLIVSGVRSITPGHTDLGVETFLDTDKPRGKRGEPGQSSRTAHARPTSSPRSAGVLEGRGRFVGCTCDDTMARARLSFPFPANGRGRIECRGGAVTARAPQVSMFPSVSGVCPCSCLCLPVSM